MCAHRSKVRSPDERTYGSLRLNVKRQSVFEDSFNKLRSKTPAEMRAKLSVAFVGEEGIDAGGVSREWYQVRAVCLGQRAGAGGGRVLPATLLAGPT
jgi:E3 ubiquitin-protein ligase HUWE1